MKHRMIERTNRDTRITTYTCSQCDRVVEVSEEGYRVLNRGDQEAEHAGGLFAPENDVIVHNRSQRSH